MLAGLLLNAAFGWWWADPLAALVIFYVAAREGRQAWNGDGLSILGEGAVIAPGTSLDAARLPSGPG